jgi:ABC-type branched-subunit amino acid transport system substrate-binding protein
MQRRDFVGVIGAVAATTTAFAAQPSPGEDGSVGESEIVLGHTGILSGPLGAPIKILLAGSGLAFDAVNAQGGIGRVNPGLTAHISVYDSCIPA